MAFDRPVHEGLLAAVAFSFQDSETGSHSHKQQHVQFLAKELSHGG